MMKFFVWLVLSITISSCLFGQKKFEVVLSFPDTLSLTDLSIQIDNGLGRTSVPYKTVDNNQVMLSDFYYSKYAAVIVSLPKTENSVYKNFFFLGEKPAKIKFLPAAKDSSPLDRYVLTNAYDFISERNKMNAYVATEVAEVKKDPLAPTLVEEVAIMEAPIFDFTDIKEVDEPVIHWELLKEPVAEKKEEKIVMAEEINTVGKMWMEEKNETINSKVITANKIEIEYKEIKESTSLGSAASGGYLARPSNIYTETKAEVYTSIPSEEEPVPLQDIASMEEDSLLDLQMQIVEKDDIQAADVPLAHQIQAPLSTEVEDSALQDETEEQNRRAAERLHKLRNLSFNVNAADPNNEFETVPAYIRRNMELYNNNTQVENFYSNYEVKTDDKNQTHISTINTFLDGKKPD